MVATFEKGAFTVSQSNKLDWSRTWNTLVVRDSFKNESLNVRYLNHDALELSRLLQYPGAKPIRIPQTRYADLCVGDVGQTAIDVEAKAN